MIRDIDDLLPSVMIYAPSVPEPIAIQFLREAARDLCSRARLWKEWDEFTIPESEAEGVCTIADARIVEIEECSLDGKELDPVTPDWLKANVSDWSRRAGAPSFVTQMRPNTLTIVPQGGGDLRIRVVLIPSLNAQTLPEFLVEDYATVLGRGAAAKILTLPNPEYANPQLGAAHQAWFNDQLDTVSSKARKGQQKSRTRTVGQYF